MQLHMNRNFLWRSWSKSHQDAKDRTSGRGSALCFLIKTSHEVVVAVLSSLAGLETPEDRRPTVPVATSILTPFAPRNIL
jgi:hypothetical protein